VFNLDPGKLLVVGVVAVLVLGREKLPGAALQLGGAWRSITEFRRRMEAEVRHAVPDLPSTDHLTRLARSPAALLDHLGTMDSSRHGPGGPVDEVPPAPEALAPAHGKRMLSGDAPVHGDAGLN